MDTISIKYMYFGFLYNREVSFIRGLVVNLAPLTAVANCDKARILKGHIDKRCIESQLLGKNLRYIWASLQLLVTHAYQF